MGGALGCSRKQGTPSNEEEGNENGSLNKNPSLLSKAASAVGAPCPVKVFISNEGNSEDPEPMNIKEYDGLDIYLRQWNDGSISSDAICSALIENLFKTEFVGNGDHWDVDYPSGRKIEGKGKGDGKEPEEECFEYNKKATWDWKDIYSVAEAKGLFKLNRSKSTILLENYSYYVAG